MFDEYCVSVVCRKLTIKSITNEFIDRVGNDIFIAKSYIIGPLKMQTWKIIFVLICNNMVTVQTVSV